MINRFKPVVFPLALLSLSLSGFAQETKKEEKVNKECPITGKAVLPNCTTQYEGKTYAFCSGKCRTKFVADRASSIYQRIGGKAAIGAAVDLFYTKVLADKTVSDFFEGVNMKKQARKQKEFFSAALGGPEPWKGKGMKKAHKDMGVTEAHFNAIAGHLKGSLEELKVKKELIDEVLAVVGTTKGDIVESDEPKK
ncbi:MAG: group 1 truncated hemoglobin [Akkermansiaceae bacterium]